MKKLFYPLILLVLMLTGCSSNLDDAEIQKLENDKYFITLPSEEIEITGNVDDWYYYPSGDMVSVCNCGSINRGEINTLIRGYEMKNEIEPQLEKLKNLENKEKELNKREKDLEEREIKSNINPLN